MFRKWLSRDKLSASSAVASADQTAAPRVKTQTLGPSAHVRVVPHHW